MKARSPEKVMDVSDEKVSDEDGSLSPLHGDQSVHTNVKVRIWISKVVFQPFIQIQALRCTMSL